MSSQDSENDYMVLGFKDGSLEMDVVATGMGGMAAVVESLSANFEADIAVALFRVTAVDDRGVTVSYRTKVIHVTYVGPKMPVMKKAKAAGYNAAFRAPFISNMQIQTDDVTDLTEERLEKALRASGGAHAPTGYDFTNTAFKKSG